LVGWLSATQSVNATSDPTHAPSSIDNLQERRAFVASLPEKVHGTIDRFDAVEGS